MHSRSLEFRNIEDLSFQMTSVCFLTTAQVVIQPWLSEQKGNNIIPWSLMSDSRASNNNFSKYSDQLPIYLYQLFLWINKDHKVTVATTFESVLDKAKKSKILTHRFHFLSCSFRYSNLILNLFSLMVDANIPDIALEPDKTVKKVILYFFLYITPSTFHI